MPNWTITQVSFLDTEFKKAAPKMFKVSNVFQKSSGSFEEFKEVDFNLLVPMPEELAMHNSGMTSQHIWAYLSTKMDKASAIKEFERVFSGFTMGGGYLKKAQEYVSNIVTPEELENAINRGENFYNNFQKYGYFDWYNWAVDNWGTKWNASDTFISYAENDMVHVTFNTAWSPPIPWLHKLSYIANFEFIAADEDIGSGVYEGLVDSSGLFSWTSVDFGTERNREIVEELWGEEAFGDIDYDIEEAM